MRSMINEWLKEHNIELLHPDLWPGDGINCGVTETAIASVALGIAEHQPVAIYGIAGFILLRAAEVLKLYKPKHAVLILNAGANGCYPKNIGYGHQIDYDQDLCQIFGITLDEPYNGRDPEVMKVQVDKVLSQRINEPGWHLIRLGWDL